MKTLTKWMGIALGAMVAAGAMAQEAKSPRELLQMVEQGRASEASTARAREQRFQQQRAQQQQLLADARREKAEAEALSERLENTFEENELIIVERQAQLNERLGSLKELFGVLQQVAGDTRAQFENSVISAQYPGRGEFLTDLAKKMGSASELATIEEIEKLWFEIQREMTATGEVQSFAVEVIDTDGQKAQRQVVRVGAFNLISDGGYLKYNSDTGNVSELNPQPKSRYVQTTSDLANASTGNIPFGMDITRGSLLELLIQTPGLEERIGQGGPVGYVIIALGIIGILIALERLITLSIVNSKVKSQLKKKEISTKNPLGRVLRVYEENQDMDPESLEVKLGEAILKEMPKLNRGVTFLKIIAVVAPLLGLLGTVTGMIVTFQSITLFGTGDPKLMAGGISQALVTTVLGLCVAIPTVLLHTLVAGRSKHILHILQERSAGLIAERMEQRS